MSPAGLDPGDVERPFRASADLDADTLERPAPPGSPADRKPVGAGAPAGREPGR